VYTVHEELRQTLSLVQGAEFEFKNHLARRLTRGLAKNGQAGLALELLPLALFAQPEQDEGKALIAVEVARADKDSPLPRKASDELKARGPELLKSSPTPASAQTLAFALDGARPGSSSPPRPPTQCSSPGGSHTSASCCWRTSRTRR
jgi:hypothetical protein